MTIRTAVLTLLATYTCISRDTARHIIDLLRTADSKAAAVSGVRSMLANKFDTDCDVAMATDIVTSIWTVA